MTTDQILAVALIVLMMAAFVWERFRYDVVAAVALVAAVLVGIVPFDAAFSGFSDDIVIIVGSALLVSAAVARSGIMEIALSRYAPRMNSVRAQLITLIVIVAVLSAFVKNIGALAIMIPVAFQFARRSNVSPSVFLMPMAFAALLGGLMTQVGTSPNIIVSRLREEISGEPFTMFDFTPLGAALTAVGVVFLTLFYWLVPARRRQSAERRDAIVIKNYVAEAKVTQSSAVRGKTVSDLLRFGEGGAKITSILRDRKLKVVPLPDVELKEGDILLIEGESEALGRMVAQGRLDLTDNRPVQGTGGKIELEEVEAIVGEHSPLIDFSAQRARLFESYDVNLLAISRRNERITERLGSVPLRMGDIVVMQGDRRRIAEVLRALDLLPLAERTLRLGGIRRGLLPIGILAAAVIVTAFGVIPVAVAFFTAAVLIVLTGALPLRETYGALDAPILVMLAALIPVSDSLRTTGVTDLISTGLASLATGLPPAGALALILVTAMAVTPFLNNAATVLVMAPIAAGFAAGLSYKPEAFLMAVAIGAGCDFLTPIGHQCNTLVMGPGGYRFSDYPRLGAPLSILIVIVAVPLLLVVWPVR
jgi:di/tricarboxylate transporter